MTELNLLDALVSRLTERFKTYETLPAKGELWQKVKIFPQFLPQPSAVSIKSDDENEDIETEPQGYTVMDIESLYPCVIVKLGEVVDKEEGALDQSRINVLFLIGTYDNSKDCQGYRDVLNIIDVIRQDLLTMQARVLDKNIVLNCH